MANIGKVLGALFGSAAVGAAGAAVNPAEVVLGGVKDIIGMVHLSPELKAQLQAQLTTQNVDLEKAELAAEVASVQGQLDINKQEAASPNWFVAGWRPAVGWVCAFALFYMFLFQPFAQFLFIAFGVKLVEPLPQLQSDLLVNGLLLPLLGIGGMRTVEKIRNAQGNHS